MDTAVRTPLEIFNLPQHLVVPLFQRPYVWTLEDQWQPLWGDIRRIAELRLSQPLVPAAHFLGAVVLQAMENQSGTLQPRSIIDGQQRLTTLQLLIDASSAVFQDRGLDDLAAQLEGLAHNAAHFVTDGDTLKLRHSNRDFLPFKEVMEADPPVDYAALTHSKSLLVQAHKYFSDEVSRWLGIEDQTLRARATSWTAVLTNGLQLVVIDLRREENSQEIFETLNARGTPLTAADLIKNLVFQRLASEHVDTKHAYSELWPFDTPFWEKEVSVGRYLISRSSLFLNQWLISRLGEEVGPKLTFTRFKHFVEHEAGTTMAELLNVIRGQAEQYRQWTERAADPHADLSTVELCVYRTQAAESEALKPILVWLHEPGRRIETHTIDRIVRASESWLIRRTLMRLPSSDHGRVVADLIATHRSAPDDLLSFRVENYLRRQSATGTYWPTDAELRTSLATEPAYRRFKRPRLRMFLEAAEDHLRGYTGSGRSFAGMRVPRVGYPIEHLLPQRWKSTWPVETLQAEIDRDNHVHRLGNLTLLTTALNSSVSNGPWAGSKGKYAKLHEHDVFLLNRQVRDLGGGGWSENLIDQRTAVLVNAFIATWSVPEGHSISTARVATEADPTSVTIRDLLAAGLLTPGTRLIARPGHWGRKECEVLADGQLMLDGQQFSSISGAGHHLRRGATNGWWFWSLSDGRRLKDLRTEYLTRR